MLCLVRGEMEMNENDPDYMKCKHYTYIYIFALPNFYTLCASAKLPHEVNCILENGVDINSFKKICLRFFSLENVTHLLPMVATTTLSLD